MGLMFFVFGIGQGSADTRTCPPSSTLTEAWPELQEPTAAVSLFLL